MNNKKNERKIWLVSDWHFGHDREFIYGPRGFANVDEANEEIVRRHNEVVDKDDLVYFLGDAMLNDNEKGIECIKRLNGRIIMIRGNHDTDARMKLYAECPNVIESGDWASILKYKKYHFYLSHYPTLTANLDDSGLHHCTLNIFGHTHQKSKFYEDRPYMYCVCVDAHNGYPVNIDTIIEDIKSKYQECVNQS